MKASLSAMILWGGGGQARAWGGQGSRGERAPPVQRRDPPLAPLLRFGVRVFGSYQVREGLGADVERRPVAVDRQFPELPPHDAPLGNPDWGRGLQVSQVVQAPHRIGVPVREHDGVDPRDPSPGKPPQGGCAHRLPRVDHHAPRLPFPVAEPHEDGHIVPGVAVPGVPQPPGKNPSYNLCV